MILICVEIDVLSTTHLVADFFTNAFCVTDPVFCFMFRIIAPCILWHIWVCAICIDLEVMR